MKIILKKSFTLVEILVTILILFFISTIFLKNTLEFSSEYISVKNDTMRIISVLESAKNKALVGELDSDWGVYFVNSSSAYYMFSGSSFNSSNNFSQYFLDKNNIFIDPTTNSVKEIVFKKYSGYTNETKITISSLNSKVISDIFINSFGNIDFDIKRQ